MHVERNAEEKFELPKDLVAEASKRAKPRQQEFYKVEALDKPSFFGRVAEIFARRR